MIVKEDVIDFIINEFGDYNPAFEDILNELGVKESELTDGQIELIKNKVGDIVLKCKSCKKPFKKDDDIMVTDGDVYEAVHDECHYNYLANMHLNHLHTLEELKDHIKEKEG